GREGVVEDQDPRVLGDGAGDRGALLLPTGERDATFADHRVVPRREVLDVLVQLRYISGPIELRIGELLVQAKADVLTQRDREEEGLLRPVSVRATELLERRPADVYPVDHVVALMSVEAPGDDVTSR